MRHDLSRLVSKLHVNKPKLSFFQQKKAVHGKLLILKLLSLQCRMPLQQHNSVTYALQ